IAWGCGVAVAAAGYLVAAHQSQGHVWRCLVELLNEGSQFYITSTMGVRELDLSLAQVAASLLGWAVVLLTADWLAEEHAAPRDWRPVALAWIALFVVPAFFVREKFFRAAPFLLAAGVVWIVIARKREGEAALDGRWREHLVLWAFALGALPRIFLRCGVDYYGFFLLPPTLACAAVGMTHHLATVSGRPRSRRILAIAASTVLAGVALDGFLVSGGNLTTPRSELRTARVWRLVDPESLEAMVIAYLGRFP